MIYLFNNRYNGINAGFAKYKTIKEKKNTQNSIRKEDRDWLGGKKLEIYVTTVVYLAKNL